MVRRIERSGRGWVAALVAVASAFGGAARAEDAAVTAPAQPAPIAAEGCGRWIHPALAEGPVEIGFYEADVSTARRACPRTEVAVGGRLGLTIDTPNFYGTIGVDAQLSGSLALSPKLELFGTLDAVHYQWVQNASLKGDQLTLGQLTAGATYVAIEQGSLIVSPSARLMLPTSTAAPSVAVVGAELGAAASLRLSERFDLHGYLGADFSTGLSQAPGLARFGALINVGAQYNICSGFGVAVDANAHFFSREALDYLAPALSLRFRIWKSLGAELNATLPIAGQDRHLLLGGLRVTYRL